MEFANVRLDALDIDCDDAEASRPTIAHLRRQRKARVMHGVFPNSESALVPMLGEVGLGAYRQVSLPCRLEAHPRKIEGCGGADKTSPAVIQRIKCALPAPLVDVYWHARTAGDLADMDVTKIYVPAVWALREAAAGEGGHTLLKRGLTR